MKETELNQASPAARTEGSLKQHGSAWEKSDVAQITALAYALLASTQTGWFAAFCWSMAALYMLRAVVSHVTRKTPNAKLRDAGESGVEQH